jgi:hypothetical protein
MKGMAGRQRTVEVSVGDDALLSIHEAAPDLDSAFVGIFQACHLER